LNYSLSKQKKKKRDSIEVSDLGLGVVVHACNPSYEGGVDRRISVQGQPQAKTQDPIQKNQCKNRLGVWLRWQLPAY
jgi:hypothetical protein